MNEHTKKDIAVVVLAAGGSARLGRPKQLLFWHGSSLLRHTVRAATSSCAASVVVVLGSQAALLQREISETGAFVVTNDAWEEGMASSIRCGIGVLQQKWPAIEGAVLMVCDQPFVMASILNRLIDTQKQTGKRIVVCSYAGTFGPPVYFHKSLFNELLQLKGDVGARGIIQKYANEAEAVAFPEGSVDVDTEADFQGLSDDDQNRHSERL